MKTKKKKRSQRPYVETELACSLAGHRCRFRKICICRCHKGGNVSENEK